MFSGKSPRRQRTHLSILEPRQETHQFQNTRCSHVLGWACHRCIPRRALLVRTILALSIVYFVAFLLGPHHDGTDHFWYDPTQRITATGSGRVNVSTPSPVVNTQPLIFRSFVEKFGHIYEDNATFLNRLKGIIGREWSLDEKRKQEIGNDLRIVLGETGSIGNFLLTKKNAPAGKPLPFYMYGKAVKVTTVLWKYLSQEPIFKPRQFRRCSIVGSSGILKGSRCGATIDEAQFVVRFNIAPVGGYETDVGSKTNFTTLNPSFIRSKLNILKTAKDRSQLLAILKQFSGTYLWLPIFAVSDNFVILTKTTEITQKSGIVRPIHGHPKHFLSVSTLWRNLSNDNKTWPSTGLYSVLTLFDVCEQIDVFGFWPLPTFMNGSSAPYHYHDAIVAKKTVHTFDAEFQFLVHMHEQGVIRMHFQPCL